MLPSLLFIVSALSSTGAAPSSDRVAFQLQKNGEFIFSQYPSRALAAGEQGAVGFRVEVDAKGNVLGCKVTKSSGYPRLDNETCELIVDHAKFSPTRGAAGRREAVHDGIVNWRIPGAPSSATGIAVASAATPAKLVCKRTLKTGSLVSYTRLCLTQREWNQYANQTQDEWGALQGRKGSTNGN